MSLKSPYQVYLTKDNKFVSEIVENSKSPAESTYTIIFKILVIYEIEEDRTPVFGKTRHLNHTLILPTVENLFDRKIITNENKPQLKSKSFKTLAKNYLEVKIFPSSTDKLINSDTFMTEVPRDKLSNLNYKENECTAETPNFSSEKNYFGENKEINQCCKNKNDQTKELRNGEKNSSGLDNQYTYNCKCKQCSTRNTDYVNFSSLTNFLRIENGKQNIINNDCNKDHCFIIFNNQNNIFNINSASDENKSHFLNPFQEKVNTPISFRIKNDSSPDVIVTEKKEQKAYCNLKNICVVY